MSITDKAPKARTSLTIDVEVLAAARKYAESNNLSVSAVIEQALRVYTTSSPLVEVTEIANVL